MLVMRSAVAASPCSTFYVLVVYSTTTSEVLHEAAATPGAVASAATKLLVFSRRPVRSPSAAGSWSSHFCRKASCIHTAGYDCGDRS